MQWFIPLSTHRHAKRIVSEHFVITVQEPSTLAESHLMWNNQAWNPLPSMLSKSDSALPGKLPVPILRHLTETVSHIDVMVMRDHSVWLSHPGPHRRRWRCSLKGLFARSSSHLFDRGNPYQNHSTDLFCSAGLTSDEIICWGPGSNEFEHPHYDVYV